MNPVLWSAREPRDAADHRFGPAWDFTGPLPDDWPRGATILHLAGRVSGDAATLAQNVAMARAIAGAARSREAAHVLFASTVAVYRPGPDPIAETATPDPQTPYGKSKAAAEEVLAEALSGSATGLTILRIANLAGADALLGGALARGGKDPVLLDPVAGLPAGPERSYIGPQSFARTLARLADLAGQAPGNLPDFLNVAQPGAIAMGDVLTAAGIRWCFGPAPAPVPRVVVNTARLQSLSPLPSATPEGLVAELASLKGAWP